MSDLVERLAVLAAPLSRNRRRRTPMTDITIPPEAVEGYCRHRYGTDWDHLFNDREKEIARRNARSSITATLKAWPWAWTEDARFFGAGAGPCLILPLTENPDAEA